MATNGAVFFLGNRAHYQVLDIPDNVYSNSCLNSNQEVNSNIPSTHGNHTTNNLNNYGSYSDNKLMKPSTSTDPSPTLTHYNEDYFRNLTSTSEFSHKEDNNVILNHSAYKAYFTNTSASINNFTYTKETEYVTRNSNDAIIDIDEEIGFLGNGVKHRSRRYGGSNGSSEFILNDNDDLCNLNPSDLNLLDNDINKNKLTKRNRTFTASALLRALMARRRRKHRPEPLPTPPEPYVNLDHMACTYKDSCRCLDCQSRYFECDDDDDEDDDFILSNYSVNEYNESHQYNDESNDYYDGSNSPYYGPNSHYDGSNSRHNGSNNHYDGSNNHYDGSNNHYDGSNNHYNGPSGQYELASVSDDYDSDQDCRDLEAGCYEEYLDDSDDEVFLKASTTTVTSLTDPLIQPPKDSNPQSTSAAATEEKLEVELAAGAPVFFDHLLNHPFSCCVQ